LKIAMALIKKGPNEMKREAFFIPLALVALVALLAIHSTALAHFGMVIPSAPTVMETAKADIDLLLKFWHPFENSGMDLEKPKSFTVYKDGKATDLTSSLKEVTIDGKKAWTLSQKLDRPGLNAFVMEPQPYWEPAEDCFIIHYTKVYVDAFGDDEGWNAQTQGLKTEIVPLSKPGGLYAGNVFTGRVYLDGQAAPETEVEIEWYPGPDLTGQAPYETMVTQVVVTDGQGLFHYAPPKSGWWGFAALSSADYKIKAEGQDKDVELGAVLWVYFHDFLPPVASQK
jgi:cobalt/nickel transport protein